jgi:hypothetical protein
VFVGWDARVLYLLGAVSTRGWHRGVAGVFQRQL